jgi:hypothetical protein
LWLFTELGWDYGCIESAELGCAYDCVPSRYVVFFLHQGRNIARIRFSGLPDIYRMRWASAIAYDGDFVTGFANSPYTGDGYFK